MTHTIHIGMVDGQSALQTAYREHVQVPSPWVWRMQEAWHSCHMPPPVLYPFSTGSKGYYHLLWHPNKYKVKVDGHPVQRGEPLSSPIGASQNETSLKLSQSLQHWVWKVKLPIGAQPPGRCELLGLGVGQTVGTCVPGSVKPSPTMIASKWKEPGIFLHQLSLESWQDLYQSIGMVVKHSEKKSHTCFFVWDLDYKLV